MFYRYNNILGRIELSTQLSAYQPQGLRPFAGDVSGIKIDSTRSRVAQTSEAVQNTATRAASTVTTGGKPYGGKIPSNPGYAKIMELQNLFCRNDGLLVWQKRGMRDKVPYYFSMGLVFGGLACVFYSLYSMAKKKKVE